MTYDEFYDKLTAIKVIYAKTRGKPMTTMKELEDFLSERFLKTKQTRAAKSLKGLRF